MIKVNELRIGNYLSDRENRLCKVEELYTNGFKAPAVIGGLTSLPNKIIKLTEDILLKCGFNKNIDCQSYGYFTLNGTINNEFNTPFEIDIYLKHDGTFETGDDLPMLSLHQLQNYIFSKIGEELTVKV